MILITGANGQLGRDFRRLFDQRGIAYIATHHTAVDGCEVLDMTDEQALKTFVRDKNLSYIINCAAYNNVDKAEEERDKAYILNKTGPELLAKLAKNNDAVLVTYSTDFVFDGAEKRPYTETDQPCPVNVYGESKYEGEKIALATYDKTFVIRTSWVYGLGNHNFNKSVIQWSKARSELTIVDDQMSTPTYTRDLAEFSWDLIQSGQYGLYHLSNGGEASKFDQAKYILDKINWQGTLKPGKTDDFKLPATRAPYTTLDSSKAEKIIGRTMPHWHDAMDRFLVEMKEAGEII